MAESISGKKILAVAALHKVTRAGLQAQVTVTDGGNQLDREQALAAMRALLAIMELAAGAP